MLGLATPFKTQNYGTKLQAYAMQSIFTEMGYDTEIINFTYTSSKKRQARHTALAQKNLRQKIKYKKVAKGYGRQCGILKVYGSEERRL